ncbi:ABC transporter ATP-binding protein [Amygdalobacter nucleatus]|uniref:ABC transporter ATP-binding protein n=1 Tax=Amygdalobacter nucleatus TaxID=3029274 RepID=UPI002798BC90|nr:ABC transporter ATP-binding protein [Amygdalobacter nucleatus]WEG36716.1 ABC transporter ATP-binding protein [Amygdalobacter nucleatus]
MNTYKKLFAYVRPELYQAYIAAFLTILSAIATISGYYMLYQLLVCLLKPEFSADPIFFALIACTLLIIAACLYFFGLLMSHKLGFRLETRLRKIGINTLSKASFSFFDTHNSGYVRKVIDDNAAETHMMVAHLIPDNTRAVFMPILLLVLSFSISWRVGLTISILTLATAIVLASMMEGNDFMTLYQTAIDNLSAETVEYVRGIEVVKVFGISVQSMHKLCNLIYTYAQTAYKYSQVCKKPYVLYQLLFYGFVPFITIPLIFSLSAFSDLKTLAIELIMTFLLTALMLTAHMSIMFISMYTFKANYAIDTLEKLYKEMESSKVAAGTNTEFHNYQIELKDVCFSYKTGQEILKNINCTFLENKFYALVGASGSGKSTLAKLIAGYYEIKSGEIRIGGKLLSNYSQAALHKAIAFVFQDAKLFKKSIYENVALAKPNASKEEVFQALDAACCQPIIAKFKDGVNTVIGSQGVHLSVGEKQRIVIARAILQKAPIVILDEAQAALDADNEYELQRAFQNLMRHKTVIMIAHRLSAIKQSDEIIVLAKGQIQARGKHEDLLANSTDYQHIWALFEQANNWRVNDEKLA